MDYLFRGPTWELIEKCMWKCTEKIAPVEVRSTIWTHTKFSTQHTGRDFVMDKTNEFVNEKD